MAKQKKKRNKQYTGSDAAIAKPSVTRVAAVHRNKPQQWWHDNKRLIRPLAIALLVIAVVAILVYEIIRLAV
jgi:hypothetical protein